MNFELSEVAGFEYGLYNLVALFMASVMAGSSTRYKLSAFSVSSILWNTLLSTMLTTQLSITRVVEK